MGDWLQGFGSGLGASRPRPPRPVAGAAPQTGAWTKGASRVVKEVACCPECGCLRVKIRTNKGAVVYMECLGCGHGWKDKRAPRLA